jgi:predicted lipid-binding transport protein (Tim44 family)
LFSDGLRRYGAEPAARRISRSGRFRGFRISRQGTSAMGEGGFLVDIIIFAAIAAFLVLRLRNVLGRRTGEERQRPNPYAAPDPARANRPVPGAADDNVVALPDRRPKPLEQASSTEGLSLDGALTQIKIADPAFDEKYFLTGAKAAFEMIVGAFAAGDRETLSGLLDARLAAGFIDSIAEREAAGQTLETEIKGFQSADIVEARLERNLASVTVKFVTNQINCTRDSSGTIIDGDPQQIGAVTDIWTFSRQVDLDDPNWRLVETRNPD